MTVLRRAQPWLGTLVEIGVPLDASSDPDASSLVSQAVADAFAVIAQVQRRLSRFDPDSDVSRFHLAEVGQPVSVNAHTREVLRLAAQLHHQTGGLFDIALGSGQWCLDADGLWHKLTPDVRVDLGGIAKGYAVDMAMEALCARSVSSAWVNAGGDLRVMGCNIPVDLRDEVQGGVRRWAQIADTALATSYFGADARSALHGTAQARHVTVAAPRCAVADALTKVVCQLGLDQAEPVLRFFQAQAWIHA
ncbi:MAG: FAD:protein FMN transferase [Acidobacteriota bacterium]